MSGENQTPSADEVLAMTKEEAMILAAKLDGVDIVHRQERFPVPGTKAEKRAERSVALAFVLSGLAGIGFVVYFIVGDWHWNLPNKAQNFQYFTPILGVTLALMFGFMGIGMVLWAKKLLPEEHIIQERHDEPSEDVDRMLADATLVAALHDTGLGRRKVLGRSLLFAGGAVATVPLVALVGAMIKKPGDKLFHTLFKPNKKLFPESGGLVPLVYENWTQVSPDDFLPGGVATVFPGVRTKSISGYDGVHDASSPTLIIRLRPDQTVQPRTLKGKSQKDFQWGDFVAYSKICTHAGCPASLYEQQTSRLLCPCHQSQFEVLKDARPVFGPATRSLPKLPLTVLTGSDGKQYFYAKSDFHEAIGPAFWERP
jgi:ubiquinol-cytochrome c reductase iron-sulfur subunit